MQVGRLKKPLSAVSGDFKLRLTFKNKKQSIIAELLARARSARRAEHHG